MKKSVPTRTSMCERIKSFQEMACFLFGAGERPCRRRMLPRNLDIELPRQQRFRTFPVVTWQQLIALPNKHSRTAAIHYEFFTILS